MFFVRASIAFWFAPFAVTSASAAVSACLAFEPPFALIWALRLKLSSPAMSKSLRMFGPFLSRWFRLGEEGEGKALAKARGRDLRARGRRACPSCAGACATRADLRLAALPRAGHAVLRE